MKKLILAILAFLYINTSVGITVHLHYCMGELVDSGFWHNNENTCGNCGMEKSSENDNGCCKDEQKQVKLENDHKIAESYQLHQLLSIAIPVGFLEFPAVEIPSVTEENPLSHAPPRSRATAVYIRNCVFLI